MAKIKLAKDFFCVICNEIITQSLSYLLKRCSILIQIRWLKNSVNLKKKFFINYSNDPFLETK
jgi:hypothetical protein